MANIQFFDELPRTPQLPQPMITPPLTAPLTGRPPAEAFQGPLYQQQSYTQPYYPMPQPVTSLTEVPPKPMYDNNSMKYLGMSCVDVENHRKSCPVCSQLAPNTSLYIVIMIILLMLCAFLGKKYFD